MTVEDRGKRRRLWITIAFSMAAALVSGGWIFLSNVDGVTPMRHRPFDELLRHAAVSGLNTAGAVIWIIFPMLFLLRLSRIKPVVAAAILSLWSSGLIGYFHWRQMTGRASCSPEEALSEAINWSVVFFWIALPLWYTGLLAMRRGVQ